MRPLFIVDEERAAVKRVVDYASDRSHWYHPQALGVLPPGANPNHVLDLWSYRCVFSYTVIDAVVWRQISISVPSAGFPNPIAVWTIADLFGLEGWDQRSNPPLDWQVARRDDEHCIVVAQPAGLVESDAGVVCDRCHRRYDEVTFEWSVAGDLKCCPRCIKQIRPSVMK